MIRTSSRGGPRQAEGCPRLVVDYALVGLATTFAVPVTASERAAVQVGGTVLLLGDAVDPVLATVTAVLDPSTIEVQITPDVQRD